MAAVVEEADECGLEVAGVAADGGLELGQRADEQQLSVGRTITRSACRSASATLCVE